MCPTLPRHCFKSLMMHKRLMAMEHWIVRCGTASPGRIPHQDRKLT